MIGHPLSPLTYLRRNRRRVLPVLLVIVLAVFAVSLTAVLTGSMIASNEMTWKLKYERYSLVFSPLGVMEPTVGAMLRTSENVRRLLPVVNANIQVFGIFGSEPRLVLGLKEEDIPWFLEAANLRLVEGSLPIAGSNELVLHEDIVKSKGLDLGDPVGREVDDFEFLQGKYILVGVLKGDYPIGIASYEKMRGIAGGGREGSEKALLIFPRPGHERNLERELASLPRRSATVATYATERTRFDREVANMDIIIWILNFITVVTLSLSVGLLNVIFFIQRMGEYGILAAIGYSRAYLLKRTLKEVLMVTALGWLVGLGLSQAAFSMISRFIYEPRGIYLTGIDARTLSYTTPIPIMIGVFSLLSVFWRLWRLDPVSIVERRD